MDESGTDKGGMPYELHGGIIVPMSRAWNLIKSIRDAESRLFGVHFHQFDLEIKGERLLQKKIFSFAEGKNKKKPDLAPPTFKNDEERRDCARSFLEKGRSHSCPNAKEFRAYGLACLELVDEVFQACEYHQVRLMAAVVETGAPRPPVVEWTEFLRKDFVFLFERIFYFMEAQAPGSMAVCIFDQIDDLTGARCTEGQRLNDCIARYFTRTHTGRIRSSRIFPEPLYARSDLTTLLGVADLAIYSINHIFRPTPEWSAPIRPELKPYIDWIYRLQWSGLREDETRIRSIFHLSDLRPRSA